MGRKRFTHQVQAESGTLASLIVSAAVFLDTFRVARLDVQRTSTATVSEVRMLWSPKSFGKNSYVTRSVQRMRRGEVKSVQMLTRHYAPLFWSFAYILPITMLLFHYTQPTRFEII